ncbi:hypothetical protein DH2020_003321 [Rehmannia glutinosa]|uniref:Uncharacterized protein n=1 Tax=Rehmannia glutinosa TaxID=99300 RepID=A0ABR0XL98_REHGL
MHWLDPGGDDFCCADFNDNTGEEEDDGGGSVDEENGAEEEIDGGGIVLAGLFWERPMGFVKGKMGGPSELRNGALSEP